MSKQSSVSIIVPAFNEENYISGCLKSLLAQDYPSYLVDIIVADNGSTDSTIQQAQKLGIKTCTIPDVKVGEVRNQGVVQTSGEILAFIDSDCIAPMHWIRSAIEELESNPNLGAIGGPYFADESASWIEKVWAGKKSTEKYMAHSLAGGSFIITRKLFIELGGFDGSLSAGEDDELSHRITAAGYNLMLSPQCAVIHLGWPKSLFKVFRRQMWQGTNQIEAAGNLFNPGLILVHVFAICLLLIMGTIVTTRNMEFLILCSPPLIFIPLIAAIRKGKTKSRPLPRPIDLIQLFLIFIFYYLGRTIGLVLNYYTRISKHSIKTFK